METLKFAVRSLRSTPWFTLVAALALALGIGANSAIFSIVNALFLRPLPYANPDEIVQLSSTDAEKQLENVGISKTRYEAVRAREDVFSEVAVWAGNGFTITGNGDPEQVQAMHVSHEFFPLLGIQPALGRVFAPDEDRPGAERVVILSNALFETRYGARRDIVGNSITLNGDPYTVVGVMPPGISRFPLQQVDLWTTRPFEVPYLVPAQLEGGGYYFTALARLKDGTPISQAREAMSVIAKGYADANPTIGDRNSTLNVDPVIDLLVGNQRQTFAMLFAAVACVLLIAAANVANLVLARYAGRRKQVAIRFALGAKRRHVIAQFVAENLLLALLGGALGLALAAAAIRLVRALGEDIVPRAAEISLDPMVLVFTLGVSLLTGLVLGLIPALQVAKPDLTSALKDSSRDTTGGKAQGRIRGGLMIAEVAVSFVLLIAASLLITSFVRVQNVSPGFEPEGVFAGGVAPPPTQYADRSEALANFYSRLWHSTSAIPGAKSVALSDTPPLSGFGGPSMWAVVGRPIPPLGEQPHALRHLISPNFFDTVGVRVTRGRDFTEQDTPTSPAVAIINETFAKQAFPNESPIGKRIVSGMLQLEQEIVGVVADTHTQNLTTPPTAEMYYPLLQRPEGFTQVLVRTDADPATLTASVRAALKEVDPAMPLVNPTTMSAWVEQSMADRRLTMMMLAAFAALALVLASLGVYSVMAYSVGQRSDEIGVRMALGAQPRDVQRMVVRHGLLLSGIGVAIGIAGALILTRLMNALLFGVGASDPLTYSAIAALLLVVALVACWLPARRAARVDPMTALRGA